MNNKSIKIFKKLKLKLKEKSVCHTYWRGIEVY
jgi:hypothetical protein